MASWRLSLTAAALALSGCQAGDPIPDGAIGECARCHLPEFQGARGHSDQKPTTCAVCHSRDRWRPAILEHRWTLDGAHRKARCFACHQDDPPEFRGIGRECVDCHRKAYERAKGHDDKPDTCADCHTTASWKERKKRRAAEDD